MPPRYPIRAVSKLTGISVDTLRAWERRYQVVAPARDERGRMYSEEDVERLRLLREAVERGHAIGRVAPLSTEELRSLLQRGARDGVAFELPPAAAQAHVDLAGARAAIRRFDAPALRRELTRLAAVLPARAVAREVALPLLLEIGEAWHAGELTAAQEHLVSAELRSLIGALARLHAPAESAPRLLFSTPSGEQHELGTLVAALLAAGSGFAAVYLGPALPAVEIVNAARRVSPRAVVLGYTGAGSAPGAAAVLVEVARELSPEIALWVGGAGAAEVGASVGRIEVIADLDAFEEALRARRW